MVYSIKKRKTETAFTLIEMMVSISLLMIIGVAIAGLQYIITNNQLVVTNGTVKVEYANGILSNMEREIRLIKNGDNGAYAIESASSLSFVFYADIDADGKTEKVRYFLNGTNLTKGVIKPSGSPITYPNENENLQLLTDSIQNGTLPIFSFYNGSWPTDTTNNPLKDPTNVTNIRMIKIYLRVNSKPNDPNHDYILDSSVVMRNLKDNL